MSAQPRKGPRSHPGHYGLSDPELMLHLRDGDTSALETLIHRYWKPLVRYAARLVDSVDAAEDVVQEAFVTVWNQRAGWTPVGTPQAFLYRVVRNGALQLRRKHELRARKAPELSRLRPPLPTPFDLTAHEELNQALESAIRLLPPRRREAFVLVRFHQLSLGQVADVMGVSPQTVANHVSTAVAELRCALQRFLA